MKFLKLLDPAMRKSADGIRIEDQQEEASRQFPLLVERSRLNYWRPGDSISSQGIRILIGLAASYDLKDLRLADIVNDELGNEKLVHVDVFNVARDCVDFDALKEYYPSDFRGYVGTPIAGVWRDGVFEILETGYEARRLVLRTIDSPMSVEESVDNLRPPHPSLME